MALDPYSLPLSQKWTWYAHYPCGSSNYGSSYVKLGSFETVGDFWSHHNACPKIEAIHGSKVSMKGTPIIAYSIFEGDVLPEWEDPVNLAGSEWGYRANMEVEHFSNLWKTYILGAIGGHIPHCVGVRAINKTTRHRPMYKVEVWMSKTDTSSVQSCQRSLANLMETPPRLSYIPHQQKQIQAQDYLRRRTNSAQCDPNAVGSPTIKPGAST